MPRGEVGLQAVEDPPALHVGQEDVERHYRGLELLQLGERARRGARDQALEALHSRRFEEHLGEREVVLHDQDRKIIGLDLGPVVAGLVRLGLDLRLGVDRLDLGVPRRDRRLGERRLDDGLAL